MEIDRLDGSDNGNTLCSSVCGATINGSAFNEIVRFSVSINLWCLDSLGSEFGFESG